MTRILITGASGFVGSHLVEEVLGWTDWEAVALVRGKTIGDLRRLIDTHAASVHGDRVRVIACDLGYGINGAVDAQIGHIDYVCHLAANSHVDRSITSPVEFFQDNVMGTVHLLEWARRRRVQKFINFNTDEVFGPAVGGYDFKEEDRWRPSNPYSGSKAGQAAVGYSYFTTFGVPVVTTHMMNIFGERQSSEKLIPKAIKKLLGGAPMPIHCRISTGAAETTEPHLVSEVGERHWMHASCVANATLFLLARGQPGEFYNVVGEERSNLAIVQAVARIMGKDLKVLYQDFHRQRPGHDRRYSLDGGKLKAMGWVPPVSLEASLSRTVGWYLAHPEWLEHTKG